MFLLRCKTRHSDSIKLFDSETYAIQEAEAFVGKHSLMDGCSTEPRVEKSPLGRTKISRSTSFGTREAWIIPESEDARFEL